MSVRKKTESNLPEGAAGPLRSAHCMHVTVCTAEDNQDFPEGAAGLLCAACMSLSVRHEMQQHCQRGCCRLLCAACTICHISHSLHLILPGFSAESAQPFQLDSHVSGGKSPRALSVRGNVQCSRQNLPSKVLRFVMSLPASLTCSATPGKTAARSKMPTAGFHGSSNKVEGVLARVLPVGRTFCQRL